MKKFFEVPELDIKQFETEDVMTTSPIPDEDQLPDDEL